MKSSEFKVLKENLDKGFFVHNLYEMATLCEKLMRDSAYAPVFYVLRGVFLDVARDWDERRLPADEAARVQQRLEMPITEVLEELENQRSKEALFDSLTRLVTARLQAL